MKPSDHVTFTSAFFPVEPGEDAQTNPGIYGRALAEWLAGELRRRGVAAEDPEAEDWGWCITVKRRPLMVRVACANVYGSTTEWRAFAFAERGPLQWLRRSGDPAAEVRPLRDHLARDHSHDSRRPRHRMGAGLRLPGARGPRGRR